jgi:hypothetical protein
MFTFDFVVGQRLLLDSCGAEIFKHFSCSLL